MPSPRSYTHRSLSRSEQARELAKKKKAAMTAVQQIVDAPDFSLEDLHLALDRLTKGWASPRDWRSPQADTGLKGDTGPQGPPGPPGDTSELTARIDALEAQVADLKNVVEWMREAFDAE